MQRARTYGVFLRAAGFENEGEKNTVRSLLTENMWCSEGWMESLKQPLDHLCSSDTEQPNLCLQVHAFRRVSRVRNLLCTFTVRTK